ncbi:hypothetical protein K2173_010901 [Erythroxylum novogranatense]|uniref:Uncharacterized protein n=1 Tax=Erythroxylum novogranatense TaxID=1862640 RepID=A0AAV8SZZ5_9ROSI|nr:hypothetical protein K2173_010901 [Erythroxylum novogranatense]
MSRAWVIPISLLLFGLDLALYNNNPVVRRHISSRLDYIKKIGSLLIRLSRYPNRIFAEMRGVKLRLLLEAGETKLQRDNLCVFAYNLQVGKRS